MNRNLIQKYHCLSVLLLLLILANTLCVHAASPAPGDSGGFAKIDSSSFRMVAFHQEGEHQASNGKIVGKAVPTPQEPTENPEPEFVSLGEFCLTAYCGCAECCGEYALNRPVDEDGNEIVIGAAGVPLVQGVSIAADPDVLPIGTVVCINGTSYTVSDTGGAINGNRIDVYFADHDAALAFGVQYAEVFVDAQK